MGVNFLLLLPILLLLITLTTSWLLSYIPLLIPAAYVGMSLLTFVVYAWDKSAARQRAWRTPESTLHMLSLCCGWPGAIMGQQVFRHKTVKTSFRTAFWFTVFLNAGLLLWLHTDQGSIWLNTAVFALEGFILDVVSHAGLRTLLLQLLAFR